MEADLHAIVSICCDLSRIPLICGADPLRTTPFGCSLSKLHLPDSMRSQGAFLVIRSLNC